MAKYRSRSAVEPDAPEQQTVAAPDEVETLKAENEDLKVRIDRLKSALKFHTGRSDFD